MKKNLNLLISLFLFALLTNNCKANCSYMFYYSPGMNTITSTIYISLGDTIILHYVSLNGTASGCTCWGPGALSVMQWYKNGILVQSDTGTMSQLVVYDSGAYFVQTLGGLAPCDYYATVQFSSTGIQIPKSFFQLMLYPNLSPNKITLKSEKPFDSKIKYSIINVMGQAIFNNAFSADGKIEQEINISSLAKGVYFISIFIDDMQYQLKFLKM